jgi:hypothetical protein
MSTVELYKTDKATIDKYVESKLSLTNSYDLRTFANKQSWIWKKRSVSGLLIAFFCIIGIASLGFMFLMVTGLTKLPPSERPKIGIWVVLLISALLGLAYVY